MDKAAILFWLIMAVIASLGTLAAFNLLAKFGWLS